VGHEFYLDTKDYNQLVFTSQAYLIICSKAMLRDFTHDSGDNYKHMADVARANLMRIAGFQEHMGMAIQSNLAPMLKGSDMPWYDIMHKKWPEQRVVEPIDLTSI
jgi:hypothetical protein